MSVSPDTKAMPQSADDLPEINLDDIVGETTPSKPATKAAPAHPAPGLDLDIDFDEPVAAARPSPPPPRAKPSPAAAVRSVAKALKVDLDDIDISLGEEAPSAPSPEAPVLPDMLLGDEPEAVTAKPMTQSPKSATLDLDALLADLDMESKGEDGGLGESLDAELEAEAARESSSSRGALPEPELQAELEPEPELMSEPGFDPEAVAPSAQELAAPSEEESFDIDGPEADAPLLVAPDDSDAPPLPISAEEPPPVTRLPPGALMPDPSAFEALRKLAGPAGDPEGTRRVLHAALSGRSYDPRQMPDARPMVVALMRVMVDRGVDRDELVEAIMAALME